MESLPLPFQRRLKSMYAGEPQQGSNGLVEIEKPVRIQEPSGEWLYHLCLNLRPAKTLEVGMAYGFSTLYILAAIHDIGNGNHTAIDPFQEYFHNVGLLNVDAVGMDQHFRFLREYSVCALADLKREGEEFDLIFIDGNHRFDDVLIDFTLAAELCPIGGSIVFDDASMPSIRTVLSWIRSNRSDFQRLDNPEDFAHFSRVSEDKRKWDHFVNFGQQGSFRARIARRARKLISGALARVAERYWLHSNA